MRLKILIAAGGSGGHLFPAQQLAELMKGESEILFAGHKLGESPFFEREKISFAEIASAPPKWGKWLSFFKASLQGFSKSVSLIRSYAPDVVVGFGSYHAFPVLLAAAVLRKKIVLFEANCILGKVNRLFSPAAKKIAVQFPQQKALSKGVFVPYLPWKKEKQSDVSKERARGYFGLEPGKTTLLVFGGSQGAAFLNEAMPKAARLLGGVQVIHLTGKGSVRYEGIPSCVKECEKEMPLAYAAADIAVCRSGAGTVAELIRHRKPALLIPFPHASENHQWINGQFLKTQVGGARLLEQAEASPEKIAAEIEALLAEGKGAMKEWKIEETTDFSALVRAVGEMR